LQRPGRSGNALAFAVTTPVSLSVSSAFLRFSLTPATTYNCMLQVDLVLLPAVTGDFGAMPGHVPTVAQLRPGVITIHNEMDKDIEKYFVSSGYAFVHADSTTDIVAVEAFKLDEFDTDAVRAGLQEYTAKLASLQGGGKGDDYEIAAAQIGVEVYSAMNSAI